MESNKTVFVLWAYYLDPEEDGTKLSTPYITPTYPYLRIRDEHIGIYTTLKNAEAEMQRRIEELKESDKRLHPDGKGERIDDLFYDNWDFDEIMLYDYGSLYCFLVDEIRLDMQTLVRFFRRRLSRFLRRRKNLQLQERR
jgi:hypothetical protein